MGTIKVVILVTGLLLTFTVPGPTVRGQAGGVQVELDLNKAQYSVGDSVKIRLTLTNRSMSSATFQFTTGQLCDFMVSRDGHLVWQWSYGRAFTQAFTTLTLMPNDSKVFNEFWDQRDARGQQAPAGEYEMMAVFPAGEVGVVVPNQHDILRVRFAIVGGSR